MAYVANALSRRVATLAVVLSLALAAACGNAAGDAISPSCADFDVVEHRAGLISRAEAEDTVIDWLSMSAPEVSPTEVERVWASCLTTYRSYEDQLLGEDAWTNPEIRPPDMPVWIVEVKGISRPAGISAANADNPFRYAMDIINARTGEMLERARYQEPMLQPAKDE